MSSSNADSVFGVNTIKKYWPHITQSDKGGFLFLSVVLIFHSSLWLDDLSEGWGGRQLSQAIYTVNLLILSRVIHHQADMVVPGRLNSVYHVL